MPHIVSAILVIVLMQYTLSKWPVLSNYLIIATIYIAHCRPLAQPFT